MQPFVIIPRVAMSALPGPPAAQGMWRCVATWRVGAAGARTLATAGPVASAAATSAKPRRFYKHVTVEPAAEDGGFHVLLDGRRLRTPAKETLVVPSETLAYMVAEEWDAQETHINKDGMHLTALCNTAIDTPLTADREGHADLMVAFLETDTVCFREEIPVPLYELEVKLWDPLVRWFESQYGVELPTTTALLNPVPQATLDAARARCLGLNEWEVVGFDFAVKTSKSFVIGDALVSGVVGPDGAADAARAETLFQLTRFAEVEWAHPLDDAETKARLAAAAVFTHLCSN